VKLITAHNLLSGEVLYRTAASGWSASLADAAGYEDMQADDALKSAKAEATRVTNVYLVEADAPGQPSARVRMREMIRAKGPSVRLDLGKQAEQT